MNEADRNSFADNVTGETINGVGRNTPRLLRLSINDKLINKSKEKGFHGHNFQAARLTVEQLIAEIKSGHAYSYEFVGSKRSKSAFKASDIISLDFDKSLTLDDALADPFIKEHATIIYTTPSHTDERHRFRVIFALDRTITDARELVAATTSLISRFGADEAAKDAARLFYGNQNAIVYKLGGSIPLPVLQELIDQKINSVETDQWATAKTNVTTRSALTIKKELVVRTAFGSSVPVRQAPHRTTIHCPFHDDKNPSATVYHNKSETIIYCFSCNQSFGTRKQRPEADLNDLEKSISNSGLDLKVVNLETKYLNYVDLSREITFIRSPKGSGKTELLARQLPRDASILLIGHRKALLRNMCERLHLECYLDRSSDKSLRKRYGVCLDSLKSRHDILLKCYDYVVLDESEQVLSHLLGGTLGEKRTRAAQLLQHHLAAAKQIIALDADLSSVSLNFIVDWSSSKQPRAISVVLNNWVEKHGDISVYLSKGHLVDELLNDVKQGRTCYITSNSKREIDAVAANLARDFPDVSTLAITADTVKLHDEPAAIFFQDPKGQCRAHKVILTTPAVGTGVDLAFEKGEIYFDRVYGIFEGNITDHFECDQQLSRVRHPGSVRVFVSAARSFKETDPHVIRADLRQSDIMCARFEVDEEAADQSDIFKLALAIEVRKRISLNALKDNFLAYKKRNGWNLKVVEPDQDAAGRGNLVLKKGRQSTASNLVDRICSARRLTPQDARELQSIVDRGKKLSRQQQDQLERARIEHFYRRDVFADLVECDLDGRWREKVTLYEWVTDAHAAVIDAAATASVQSKGEQALVVRSAPVGIAFLRQALMTTPIFDGTRFISEKLYSSSDLDDFANFMSRNREAFRFQFNLDVRNNVTADPTRQLGVLLSRVLVEQISAGTKRIGKSKIYYYKLNSTRLGGLEKLVRIRKQRLGCYENVGWN
ncbi:plasmid replication protein, CyRepA1 family [Mesorhizobium sp. GR13]|uniref:plasmid replication protein, CyRepA1 family n=1 Tax=Mesorhizobium sp. GR13 TaxID=2562308 RepID=UPI0010C02162|nr:plasmid replication protein, CyRepA1 family [Mesorhizobium sp. GR13]